MLRTIFLLVSACSVIAQDFGAVFNKSSVVVNFISADQAKAYETREISYLREEKWYIGGRRIQGDSHRDLQKDAYEFSQPRDFILELQYPQQRFYITHISCLVEQSNSQGRAYVTEGGVGKDYMTLVFEAKATTYFYYQVYLFGRDYQNDESE